MTDIEFLNYIRKLYDDKEERGYIKLTRKDLEYFNFLDKDYQATARWVEKYAKGLINVNTYGIMEMITRIERNLKNEQ